MIGKVVSCFVALALVTLVHGDRHEDLLASGYEYIDGVGYYAFGTNRNWTYAQDDCMDNKGRLAVINSEKELKTIVEFSRNHTEDTYVYGGYSNQYDDRYATIEGIPLKESDYTKWETGSPSHSYKGCVGINTKTGELSDFFCRDNMSYICEHQLWTAYNYIKGIGYYKLHTEGKTWTEAKEICESEGAHLLIINSQAEANAVMQIYNEHPTLPSTDNNDYVHIGFRVVVENLTNRPHDATILTIFGTSVSDLGYVKWGPLPPILNDIYYCGTLNRESAGYHTVACEAQLAFFCERELQVLKET